MSRAISLRLEDELLRELDSLASRIDRSRTYIITEAIKTYIDEYGDYRVAMDRILDKDDGILRA